MLPHLQWLESSTPFLCSRHDLFHIEASSSLHRYDATYSFHSAYNENAAYAVLSWHLPGPPGTRVLSGLRRSKIIAGIATQYWEVSDVARCTAWLPASNNCATPNAHCKGGGPAWPIHDGCGAVGRSTSDRAHHPRTLRPVHRAGVLPELEAG